MADTPATPMVQPEVVLEIDHLAYISGRRYRRGTNTAIRRFAQKHPDGLFRWTVLHETDSSCCLREPWATTFAKLIRTLNDDGLRALGVGA